MLKSTCCGMKHTTKYITIHINSAAQHTIVFRVVYIKYNIKSTCRVYSAADTVG